MILKSLVVEKNELIPVEVEIAFLPGLPQVQFLGLPDQSIKESIFRLRSAFQACGYEFPKTHQVIVNIRPTNFRKSSRGLEMAVALGILEKTKQIELPAEVRDKIIYGELSLDGQVEAPEDIYRPGRWKFDFTSVVTGKIAAKDVDFEYYSLKNLKDLTFEVGPEDIQHKQVVRPIEHLDKVFSEEQGKLLTMAALGGHSLFLAGPAGIGKSTMAKALWALMPEPSSQMLWESQLRTQDVSLSWRALVAPHHTVTLSAMTGGGAQLFVGEIGRAHKGMLLLDEYLEFQPRVQEALREPMEEGRLRIARAGRWEIFSSQMQVVATSNLCPCGKWAPQMSFLCKRTLSKCQSYREKLSGPVLDRFQIFRILKRAPLRQDGVSGVQILERIEGIRNAGLGFDLNSSRMTDQELRRFEVERGRASFLALESMSPRRSLQVRRLALTIALLKGRTEVKGEDIEESRVWAWEDFERLL